MFGIEADSVWLNATALLRWRAATAATTTAAADWWCRTWWRAALGGLIETGTIGIVGHIGFVHRVSTFIELGELLNQVSVTLAHGEFTII